MAIGNYAELKTAIATWLARDDLTLRIPEFIALFESACNRDLRMRAMEQRSQATTVADQQFYAWPDDMLEIRYIKMEATPPVVLEYLNPEAFQNQDEQYTGTPRYWSDIQAALALWPVPTAGLTVEIDYYQKLDIASADEDEGNWLIQRHPDLYLYGSLMQAEPYLMNDARLATWQGRVQAIAGQMEREEWRIKAGVSPRRVRTDYQGA